MITHLPKIEFAPFEVADTTYKVTSKSNFFVDILGESNCPRVLVDCSAAWPSISSFKYAGLTEGIPTLSPLPTYDSLGLVDPIIFGACGGPTDTSHWSRLTQMWRDVSSMDCRVLAKHPTVRQLNGLPESIYGYEALPVFEDHEQLAGLNFSVSQNLCGKNLVRLLGARQELETFKYRLDVFLEAYATPYLFEAHHADRFSHRDLTTEEALEFFSGVQKTEPVSLSPDLLHYVLHSERVLGVLTEVRKRTLHILGQVSHSLKSLKKWLHCVVACICGLSWSRRFWFLLHGSHPPKTEDWHLTSPVFGCA